MSTEDQCISSPENRNASSPEDRYVSLDGLRVHYRRAGPARDAADAPPVVLLHGGGLDSAALSWKHALGELADDRPVFALDWPGYGESDRPDGSPSVRYYVSVLERFCDAVGLDTLLPVGLSMGGGAALGFALDHPERVERLVAIGSYGLGDRVPGGAFGAAFVHTPLLADVAWGATTGSNGLAVAGVRGVVARGNLGDELAADVRAECRRPSAGDAWSAFQRNEVGFRKLRTDYTDRLDDLAVPSLFVHGEEDPVVPVEWSTRAGSLAPDASVAVLADCGHWPPRERPEEFVDVVGTFLSGPRSS